MNDSIKCEICPRKCKIEVGKKGFCSVVANVNGKLKSLTYGYSTGISTDPVEKKPLYHFFPSSKTLSFGTLGCNMGCKFCQNWHTTKSKAEPNTCSKIMPIEISIFALNNKCKSVAFTYNDPTVFIDYAIDTALEAHKEGIKTIAVSAGYINKEARERLYSHIDAANIDLKAFSEDFYKKNCSASLAPVLDTILYIKNETNVWLELTTLLIEGENDSDEELKAECDWIVKNLGPDVPLHFSAFRPEYKFIDRAPTSEATLMRAYKIAKEAGIHYVYLGNIFNTDTSTTYCKKCGKALIRRQGFRVISANLDEEARCNFCATKLDGVFY